MFSLKELLKLANIPRSTYYYFSKKTEDKYSYEKEVIKEIFEFNKGRYGYRRITITLRKEYGIILNHKTVLKIMRLLGLKCKIKAGRYKSYINVN